MSKLRVNDMASEFGITSDEVVVLLRQMDVPVRSHLSVLTDEQVSRVRARWEREKRTRAEKASPSATAAANRRRRGAAGASGSAGGTATATATTTRASATSAAPVRPARTGVRKAAAAAAPAPSEPAAPAPSTTPSVTGGDPAIKRRRRKAADVAAAAAAAAVEEAPVEVVEEMPVVEPFAPEQEREDREPPAEDWAADVREVHAPPAAPIHAHPPTAPTAPSAPASFGGGGAYPSTSPGSSNRPRPRPVVPGAPRPRPVASGSPFPRPIASASPGGVASPDRRTVDPKKGGGGGGGGGAPTMPDRNAGRRRKGKRGATDQVEVEATISKTLTSLRGAPARRAPTDARRGMAREEAEAERVAQVEREKKTVRVNEFITVSELAKILKVASTELVSFAFKNLGLMVTINQRLDFDQIELIASEFGFQAVREDEYAAQSAEDTEVDKAEDLRPRPPVVTVMGHVDHGKTSLLDYIRKANVVAGEAGGITQHIGAYHVSLAGGKQITFLDTPGHEAFTAMRARGAQVTDIVVLVVAADDRVMPQTIEAISHAKNAGVPLVVAINKIDMPGAQVDKVKQELLSHGVVLEEFGGQTLATPVSAKKGTNIETLLEQVLLQAEILDLKANPARRASGTVVEAQLDPGKGPLATVLVQNGTLRVGDDFICGMFSGRIRALLDERGKAVKEAGPAIPVQVLGMAGVPMAGDQLIAVEDATESREIAQRRQRLDREAKSRRTSKQSVSLEDFMAQARAGEVRTLRVLIKADQGGPAEALADSLGQLSTSEARVEVVHRGVGAITDSDILLAKTSGAIIVGFHVRPDTNARNSAEREGVEIKLYRVIYEAVSDIRAALEGLLRPDEREVIMGEATVLNLFKVPKIGMVAGCSVRSGTITRGARARVVRDGVEIYAGVVSSLRRFKDDVREVKEGYECGIGIENFNDLKVGDRIEAFRTEEVARTLSSSPA